LASFSEPIGVNQDVLATDLVVEQIKAEGGLRLRFAVELTRRTGSGRYVFETSSARKPANHASRSCSSMRAMIPEANGGERPLGTAL
jgi:hypothetical protein